MKKLLMILALSLYLAPMSYAQDSAPASSTTISADMTLEEASESAEPSPSLLVDHDSGEIVELDAFAKAVIDLVKDYKNLGGLALAMAVLNLLMMLLKTKLFGQWLDSRSRNVKKLALVVLGQALGILAAISTGLSPLSAVLAGLISSGGAHILYEEWKSFKKGK